MKKSEFKKKVKQRVERLIKVRTKNGAIESEADVIAGASAVMCFVNEVFFESSYDDSMDMVPPLWVFSPMCGRSILEEHDK